MTSTTLELLRKYSVPGPRYTSYPTAPYFHTDFGEAEWGEALAASAPDRELSLYAHIPFCDSLCHYCGCNMVATRDYSKTVPYLEALDREMAHTAKRVAEWNVGVQGQPAIRRGCGERLNPVRFAEIRMEIRCGGVRRITRAGNAVFL